MTRVLFVSVRDAAGSQLARALHERRGGEARSAGTAPAAELDEAVVEGLAEVGIDVSARVPARLVPAHVEWADLVVAIACDAGALPPGTERIDWRLPDPAGLCLEEVRELRAVLEAKVASLPL